MRTLSMSLVTRCAASSSWKLSRSNFICALMSDTDRELGRASVGIAESLVQVRLRMSSSILDRVSDSSESASASSCGDGGRSPPWPALLERRRVA